MERTREWWTSRGGRRSTTPPLSCDRRRVTRSTCRWARICRPSRPRRVIRKSSPCCRVASAARPGAADVQGGCMELAGQAAIVTGGGRGIGRATALELTRMGASVVLAELDRLAAERTVDEIRAAGGKALVL